MVYSSNIYFDSLFIKWNDKNNLLSHFYVQVIVCSLSWRIAKFITNSVGERKGYKHLNLSTNVKKIIEIKSTNSIVEKISVATFVQSVNLSFLKQVIWRHVE